MSIARPLLIAATAVLLPLPDAAVPNPRPLSRRRLPKLLASVDIPYEQFQLENGLRRARAHGSQGARGGGSVWYNVGSKHEPAGKTGFAHLFEHLMFNGTENVAW